VRATGRLSQLAFTFLVAAAYAQDTPEPGSADEIARATRHLLDTGAPFGTYHVSNGGPSMSWADVAREVFALRGRDPADVRSITTEEYAAGKDPAPRPAHSLLSLRRLEATGFEPTDALAALRDYVAAVPRP